LIVLRPGPFTLEKKAALPIMSEARWIPEPVLTLCRRENFLLLPGLETRASVVQHVRVTVLTKLSWSEQDTVTSKEFVSFMSVLILASPLFR
jgi:hypothetical protein